MARLHISCNYSCTLYFLVKILLVNYVKEPSHFSMLEAKLWHTKTETNNAKVARMVEFIKTCDQYPRKFNLGNFFNSIILSPPFCWEKNRSSENTVQEEWVISFRLGGNDKNLGVSLLGGMSKNELIKFFDSQNVFASNLKTINLKLFCNRGIYRFRKRKIL